MTAIRDRDLVRLYWPAELRPAFDALFAIDEALADVVTRATEPTLAAIKLAWWRERLEALDSGPPPAEPRLRQAATELLPKGIHGAALAELEAGWAAALQEVIDPEMIADRGARLFPLAAGLLGIEVDEMLAVAGRTFAHADAARRGIMPVAGGDVIAARFERRARPLTALTALAARDLRRGGPPFEPEATPGRAFALFRHRLTGRIP